jgi:hypothetical protein
MAVLVECISIIIRKDAIESKYPGGLAAFEKNIPSGSFCSDKDIYRIGFMSPNDAEGFAIQLERHGLIFMKGDKAIDFAVVDQFRGLLTPCEWLQFARTDELPIHDVVEKLGGHIPICWFYPFPKRFGSGIYFKEEGFTISVPVGWTYESHTSLQSSNQNKKKKFSRSKDKVDVFVDTKTGMELFVARLNIDQ